MPPAPTAISESNQTASRQQFFEVSDCRWRWSVVRWRNVGSLVGFGAFACPLCELLEGLEGRQNIADDLFLLWKARDRHNYVNESGFVRPVCILIASEYLTKAIPKSLKSRRRTTRVRLELSV